MSAKSAINKDVFVPHDEKMLAAVQVKRRTKKKIPFLATGGQGDYYTFICVSGQRSVFFPFLCAGVEVVLLHPKPHFDMSLLILPLIFTLMSMFTFPLSAG